MKKKASAYIICLSVFLVGCMTYYQSNQSFQDLYFSGDFKSANILLSNNSKNTNGINRVLYFFNKGTTLFMLGESEESNIYFEQADQYIDHYTKDAAAEALSLITNPMVKPYKPEDFEGVMVHFYKALNFLNLKKYDEAIVECRRVDIRLKEMSEKFKIEGKRYTRDAFAHTLMGIIYEAAGKPNDAFIAYRNAVEIYEQDYLPLFGTPIPEQLKRDIIKAAYRTGFGSEQDFYERKFGIKYDPKADLGKGEVVSFWLNGQGPVKNEWSLVLVNQGCEAGFITFQNEDLGLIIPLYIGNYTSSQQESLKSLSFLKISFPKYVERPRYYSSATCSVGDSTTQVEMAENINAIAFQSLKDRMKREVANALARVAIKKSMELAAGQADRNGYLKMAVSLTNMLSERADTRNWQTLPYSIEYSKRAIDPGKHTMKFTVNGANSKSIEREFEVKQGYLTFLTFTNLEGGYATKQ